MLRSMYVFSGVFFSVLVFTAVHPALGPVSVTSSCTIISASIGGTVLFGNNEDYYLTGTYAWFYPATATRYGCIFFGFDNNDNEADGYPQGGMNDQGLACDGNGLPAAPLNPHPEKQRITAPIMETILRECSTVNETIEWYNEHDFGDSMSYQLHFADATGDSVVISAGPDQELAFTRKGKESYSVSTNFNLANPDNGYHPCQRYDTATGMLESIENQGTLNIEDFRDILDAVHNEGTYATRYSNIFDLKNKKIYVYQHYDFEEVVELQLEEELAGGFSRYRISELFSRETTSTTTITTSLPGTSQSSSKTTDSGYSVFITFMVLGTAHTVKKRGKK